jgi:hypothetical protein
MLHEVGFSRVELVDRTSIAYTIGRLGNEIVRDARSAVRDRRRPRFPIARARVVFHARW